MTNSTGLAGHQNSAVIKIIFMNSTYHKAN